MITGRLLILVNLGILLFRKEPYHVRQEYYGSRESFVDDGNTA